MLASISFELDFPGVLFYCLVTLQGNLLVHDQTAGLSNVFLNSMLLWRVSPGCSSFLRMTLANFLALKVSISALKNKIVLLCLELVTEAVVVLVSTKCMDLLTGVLCLADELEFIVYVR